MDAAELAWGAIKNEVKKDGDGCAANYIDLKSRLVIFKNDRYGA
jgi:hypothetical protein